MNVFRRKGFTLIELLVTIAIIGVLSAVIITGLNNANNAAQDSKRKEDIEIIKNALVSYRAEHFDNGPVQGTPCGVGGGCSSLDPVLQSFLSKIPKDPNGTNYTYLSANGFDCVISATLSTGGTYEYDCATNSFVTNGATNGACGSANKTYAYSDAGYGTDTLCSFGTASPSSPAFPSQGGSTSWACNGSGGGSTASCSASRPLAPVNGACGSANKTYAYSDTTYGSDTFCSAGTASPSSPAFPSQGGSTSWACNGSGGGSTASCSASRPLAPVNGACGSSNGLNFYSAPSTNLCSTGTATSLSGTGPWTWGCNGSNGGTSTTATACSANLSVNGACGVANSHYRSSTPTGTDACTSGTITGMAGSYSWTCAGSNGGTSSGTCATVAASYAVQSFTTVGTTSWTVPTGVTSVDYLVVGGGGGGAKGGYYYSDGNGTGSGGGGGGAGGVLTGTLSVTPGNGLGVTVGAGGALGSDGANGGNSVFSSITAIGGGGGGSSYGHSGGSGGGGCSANNSVAYSGGSGTSGQGYAGGTGNSASGSWSASGGGGGAGSAGGSNTNNYGAPGGNGVYSTITGSSVGYGAGGVGSSLWGGTNNSYVGNTAYGWGIAGRGYGGNGGSNTGTSGGSGVVIIKYINNY